MTTKESEYDERSLLYQRLTRNKDKILESTHKIEDCRKKYLNQNQHDEDGSIESEIFKQIYTIIACFSELVGYTQGKSNDLYLTLLNYSIFSRSTDGSRFSQTKSTNDKDDYSHIACSGVLDALCVAVNSIIITWKPKKDPIVNFAGLKLESLFHLNLPGS